MDSYFSRDDDLVVPQADESTGLSSSLDYWFQWGEGFSSLSRCGELPMDDYCGGNSKASLHRTDGQFDGLSEMNWIDDTFMSSFLEEVPSDSENLYRPVGMSNDSECSFDNLLTDMIEDSQSISSDRSHINSSKYLKTPALPLSMNSNGLDDTTNFMLSNTEQRKCSPATKAPVIMVLRSSELNASHKEDGHVDEEASLGETVLQELEVVMTQWTQETRICCRDAMYRLAKSSKQRRLQSQGKSGELNLDEPRFRKTTLMQSEMNTFDSTIAHLLFNNLNCDSNLSRVPSAKLSEQVVTTTDCYEDFQDSIE